MKLSIKEIEKAIGVNESGQRSTLDYVSIDSRQIGVAKKTLFFALKGTQVDGHEFIVEAAKNDFA